MISISENIEVNLLSNNNVNLYSTRTGFHYNDKIIIAGAIDYNKEIAIKKATSELIERYYLYNSIIGKYAIPFEKLDSQTNFFSYELNHKGSDLFITGHSSNGKSIYIPLDYIIFQKKTSLNYVCSSVGTACNLSKYSTILNCLLEMIERHNLVEYWNDNISSIKVLDFIQVIDSNLANYIFGLNINVYFIPTEHSSYLTFCYFVNEFNKITFGASCKLNLKDSIEASILEAIQLHNNFNTNLLENVKSSNTFKRIYENYYNSSILIDIVNSKTIEQHSVFELTNFETNRKISNKKLLENSYFFNLGVFENRKVWKVFNKHYSNNYNSNNINKFYPFP